MPELKYTPGLLRDYLSVFNFKRAQELILSDDDQLWVFVADNQRFLKRFFKGKRYLRTGSLYGYPHGEKHFRKLFFRELEENRKYAVNMLIHDFCLGRQEIVLGYWGKSGYLDGADSCNAVTSKDFMPDYEDDYECYRCDLFFHLMEIKQVDNIIDSLKVHIDELQINTPIDISRIEKLRNFCFKHEGFKIIYVYDV